MEEKEEKEDEKGEMVKEEEDEEVEYKECHDLAQRTNSACDVTLFFFARARDSVATRRDVSRARGDREGGS